MGAPLLTATKASKIARFHSFICPTARHKVNTLSARSLTPPPTPPGGTDRSARRKFSKNTPKVPESLLIGMAQIYFYP